MHIANIQHLPLDFCEVALGVTLNATEVELVVNKIDQDGDGMVDLREFRSWLHGDQNNKDGSDAPSLQAMLLKAKLNAR